MAQTSDHIEIKQTVLLPDEAHEFFDREVRRLMDGMSGDEFIRRWESGEFAAIADQPGNRHIMRLALMMPRDIHGSR